MLSLQEWQAWIDDIVKVGISPEDLKVLAEALELSEQPPPERPMIEADDQARPVQEQTDE